MNYNYSLEKNSKKLVCPNCNKKRYVRFINNETNEYLDYSFGRCDRETSCGYFNKPVKSLPSTDYTVPIIEKKEISTIDKSIAQASLKNYQCNHLYLYLSNYFDKDLVLQTFKKYYVGTSKKWDGSTVFWQIDNHSNIRTGKIMLYNSSNGKRVKTPYNHISWAHKALKMPNFNLKQCLFGLHLLDNNTKTIGLVESEKTAIIMEMFLPNCIWIATGSKQNLKEEMLSPIKQYKIIVYPDKHEFDDWNNKCIKLNEKGFNITCSNLVEKSTMNEGADLADIYFELSKNKETTNSLPTPTESIFLKLYSKNSAIKDLVNTFCLTDEGGNEISFKV